jgi:hypothetical protein
VEASKIIMLSIYQSSAWAIDHVGWCLLVLHAIRWGCFIDSWQGIVASFFAHKKGKVKFCTKSKEALARKELRILKSRMGVKSGSCVLPQLSSEP